MNRFDDSVIEMVESCWIGTELARKLGLKSNFFSRFAHTKPKGLNPGIEIQKSAGLILVRVPVYVNRMLRDESYVAVKIDGDDDSVYDHVLQITAKTSVGFWK